MGKYLICNKDIYANDASSLRHDGRKTLTSLKTRSSLILSIDHQYNKYTQAREFIGDRETAFCKQYRSGNCRPDSWGHSLINKLKKDNVTNKPGTEAAAASTSFPSDYSLLIPRSSTTRTRSSNGNESQFEQICFICN